MALINKSLAVNILSTTINLPLYLSGPFNCLRSYKRSLKCLFSAVGKFKLRIYEGAMKLSTPHRSYLTGECLRMQYFTPYDYEDCHILGPTSCSLLEIHWRSGKTCCLQLQATFIFICYMRYCLKERPYSMELINLTVMKCVRGLYRTGKKVRL